MHKTRSIQQKPLAGIDTESSLNSWLPATVWFLVRGLYATGSEFVNPVIMFCKSTSLSDCSIHFRTPVWAESSSTSSASRCWLRPWLPLTEAARMWSWLFSLYHRGCIVLSFFKVNFHPLFSVSHHIDIRQLLRIGLGLLLHWQFHLTASHGGLVRLRASSWVWLCLWRF